MTGYAGRIRLGYWRLLAQLYPSAAGGGGIRAGVHGDPRRPCRTRVGDPAADRARRTYKYSARPPGFP